MLSLLISSLYEPQNYSSLEIGPQVSVESVLSIDALPWQLRNKILFNQSRPILGGVLYLESSSKFLGLMSPWYEHPADSSRMMIPAYQNDLQMFPIFRMQFASLNDLCMALRSNVKKLDLRVNISGCASYGAFSRNLIWSIPWKYFIEFKYLLSYNPSCQWTNV